MTAGRLSTKGQLPLDPFDTSRNVPLFILGSGFSHSVCPDYFPVTGDLLRVALSSNALPENAMLRGFLAEFFDEHEAINFEKVATLLVRHPFPAVQEHPLAHPTMFQELLGAISKCLGNPNFKKGIKPETAVLMSAFAGHLKERDAIVLNLNYDLLLESFLQEDWSPLTGYCMSFHVPFTTRGYPLPSEMGRSSPTILKPHGSLNWGVIPEDWEDIARAPIYLAANGFREPIFRTKFQGNHHESYRYYPYIIPPIVGKAYEHRSIRQLWNIARRVLTFRSEVHVIGFSLPESDVVMEYLFRSIGGAPVDIHLVDLCLNSDRGKAMRERFEAAFQVKRHEHQLIPHAMDAVEYLQQYLDGSA